MKLSDNFTLDEMCRTSTGVDNVPENTQIDFLKLLCVYILQPIRDEHGEMSVNSGYRSKGVNKAVGGTNNSQHKKGQAVDISPKESDLWDVYEWIVDNLEFGTCIIYPTRGFIHIALL
ncbi:MAG: DUF882 domain-containing protein, partial [Gammaproteobacteria bacterium]|nr:DUF882 domain-containing protein [Gammaproteobacteria bacterium]